MSRYDWPAGPESRDDGIGRARYNARFMPAPDVRNVDGSLAPIVARARPVLAPATDPPAPRRRGRRSPEVAAPPVTGGFVWFPIGPSTLTNGQATGHPSVSGRVRDLAVEPSVGDRIYAASAAGGVWFSADRGSSWAPLDQFVVSPGRNTLTPVGNALATGAVHVLWGSAADGSADEVFVGTGEAGSDSNGQAGGSVAGIGILHTVGPATGTAWTRPSDTDRLRGHSVRRIAEDPRHRFQLFAATTDGMWVRVPSTGAWSFEPRFGVGEVLDVAVLRTMTPDRIRVFYALRSPVAGKLVTDLWVAEVARPPTPPGDIDFSTATVQKVPLAGFHENSRLRLATFETTHLWVLGVGPAKDRPAHLALVDPAADLGALAGAAVTGVPGDLFQSASDQSEYDMALAAHPARADRVYVGGATESIGGVYNASLYRMEITGAHDADAVRIGAGVHADVHAITTGPTAVPSARAVWIGCDGGVFVSESDGDAGSFTSRNNALATLQPGFVASHPTNDGLVAAGFQDNGTSDRLGDTVWRERFEGDGGGVVYDPRADNRYFRQYTAGSWESSDGNGSGPVHRFGSLRSGAEDEESIFYSGAAALDHGGTVHLAVGTNRVWWSPDWGDSWVTVPTGTDPRGPLFPDLVQDVLAPPDAPSSDCCAPTYTAASGVITCRLAPLAEAGGRNRVRLYALWTAGLSVFEGSRATGSTGSWTWRADTAVPIRDARDAQERGDVATGAPVAFLAASYAAVNGRHYTFANDMNVHDPAHGAHGSCYITTTGANAAVDTLWWYDGDSHVVPCGLRKVLAGRGTWPSEADRIVAPALSVVVDPTDVSVVYVGTSVGVVKGKLTLTGSTPSWTWSVFDNGLPEAAVQDLSAFHDGELTLLRAALQARGVWEVDLRTPVTAPQTFVRVYPSDTRRHRTTELSGPVTRGEAGLRYDASPDIVVDATTTTWPTGGPNEGAIFEQLRPGRAADHAAQEATTRLFRVHVLVHDRWFAETAPADVKVALLRHEIVAPDADVPLGALWPALVNVANGQPVPNPWPGGWLPAGSSPIAPITAPLSARIPRAATFDLDLSGLPSGVRVMLLAVVMNAGDRLGLAETTMADLTEATTVRQLVLNTRHAAARSLLLR